VSHQDGFGNDRTQPTGSSKPHHDDDGVKKKGENVAHAQDGTKPKKLKNSGACGIRHPQVHTVLLNAAFRRRLWSVTENL
jgi:hypothetical protein